MTKEFINRVINMKKINPK